jgi:hypothetical protein
MVYLSLALLLLTPTLISTHVNNHLQYRDVTTVYQPTTVHETVIASNIEGTYRKTRRVYKHRHEVIKQTRQVFENVDESNQQLDPFREYNLGKYRNEYDADDSDYKAYDADDYDEYCKGIEWCCKKGEGCDENEYEYEECNEGEEGCEEYFEKQDFIIRELDLDIYAINIDEYVGTTIVNEEDVAYNLLDGTNVINNG